MPEGLGNERDQVGRYLMNYPRNMRYIRVREWPHWLERYAGRPFEGGHGFCGIRLRESQQLKEGVLNSCTHLLPHQFYPWSFSPVISVWRKFVGRARAWVGYERSSDGRSRCRETIWPTTTLFRLSQLTQTETLQVHKLRRPGSICQHTGIAEAGGVAARVSRQPAGPHDWTDKFCRDGTAA